jgi:multidrug efflux pump subunit AcrA (membrane-fusion protein)
MSVEVATEPAATGDLTTTLAAFGVVRAGEGELRTISSRAGGRVEAVLARRGEEVTAGKPLFRLERAPLELASAQARAAAAVAENALATFDRGGRTRRTAEMEAAVAEARTAVVVTEKQATRTASLRQEGLSSEKASAEAQQAAERARRELATAERNLEAYRSTDAELERATLLATRDAAVSAAKDADAVLAASEVLAPVAGRVASIAVRIGDKTEPGTELATLLAGDRREIAFGVTAAQRATIPADARVTWKDALGAIRSGRIRGSATLVDAALGLEEMLAIPEEGQAPPLPGEIVRGEIELRRLEAVVLVPTRALVRSAHGTSLVVAAAGVANVVPVEVIGRHEGVSAVSGAVKAGDQVIVEGAYNLPSGARVHPAATAEKEHEDSGAMSGEAEGKPEESPRGAK